MFEWGLNYGLIKGLANLLKHRFTYSYSMFQSKRLFIYTTNKKDFKGGKFQIRPAQNLIGEKYGMLTVIERAPYKVVTNSKTGKTQRVSVWNCVCDCGNPNYIQVAQQSLKTGNTKSCGCMQINAVKKNRKI